MYNVVKIPTEKTYKFNLTSLFSFQGALLALLEEKSQAEIIAADLARASVDTQSTLENK